jgi:hypothetical protein
VQVLCRLLMVTRQANEGYSYSVTALLVAVLVGVLGCVVVLCEKIVSFQSGNQFSRLVKGTARKEQLRLAERGYDNTYIHRPACVGIHTTFQMTKLPLQLRLSKKRHVL